jgi:hypothetical protein
VNDGFSTDHEALARRAVDFGGLAERAGTIAGELDRTLDALGRPWGDDEVGQSFSAVHSGPSQQTRTGLAAASGHLDDMGTRLTTMATVYKDVDTDSADRIDKV